MKLIYSQKVMKLVRIIMIKLLLNVCTCLHSNCHDFCQIIYLHVISTNFETRLPRYSLRFFWRGWNFVKLLVRSNHYESFVRTSFLKLCRKDNLCQSQEAFKLLLIKINFVFSGGQKSRIFWSSWNLLRSQFWNFEHFFLKLCQNNYMYEISTNFETELTRYNICTMIS